ncbi:SIS domain [seawater metagenome]|uniref:SIS domain n=1 Tax=seawater metagenome TaxID=1561972 RepID=A0A5E8CLV5_9ZZZZ
MKKSYKNILSDQVAKSIEKINEEEIYQLAIYMSKNKDKNIFCMGVGKSENYGKHMADMLKSLGYSSFLLNHTDCLHGDLGCIKPNDIVFIISKSGKSQELIKPSEYIKKKGGQIIGLFCEKDNILNKLCHKTIILPRPIEMDPGFNLVPTTSIIVYNIFLSLLIRHLFAIDEINLEKYGSNHPAGHIGQVILTKVKDSFIPIEKVPIFSFNDVDNIDLFKIMEIIDIFKVGMACFLDIENKLVGVITNGVIIKNLVKNKNKKIDVRNIIDYNPAIIKDNYDTRIFDLKLTINHVYFPVIENEKFLGLYYNILNK